MYRTRGGGTAYAVTGGKIIRDDSSSLLIRPPGGEIFWVLLKN